MNCGLDSHKLTDNMDKILKVVKKALKRHAQKMAGNVFVV